MFMCVFMFYHKLPRAFCLFQQPTTYDFRTSKTEWCSSQAQLLIFCICTGIRHFDSIKSSKGFGSNKKPTKL